MADIITKLFLEDLEVLVDIGIHDFEINKPQRLQISVSVSLDPTQIDDADEIGATFDYDFIRLKNWSAAGGSTYKKHSADSSSKRSP